MHKITLAVACVALAGCAASMTPSLPMGRINVAGGILAPCSPDHRGARACDDALFNTSVISQIHKGQSQNEVRGIMRHDAEKREVDGFTESWGYLTSYQNQMITWITFTDRKVSSLTHEIVEGH
ncbi:MAG: hypothetical protein DMF58_09640 [Acidobacteria bacterium]|nr:MAG: hypothetical protein DMF58_09640 [Acidobacteriota bacterium]